MSQLIGILIATAALLPTRCRPTSCHCIPPQCCLCSLMICSLLCEVNSATRQFYFESKAMSADWQRIFHVVFLLASRTPPKPARRRPPGRAPSAAIRPAAIRPARRPPPRARPTARRRPRRPASRVPTRPAKSSRQIEVDLAAHDTGLYYIAWESFDK